MNIDVYGADTLNAPNLTRASAASWTAPAPHARAVAALLAIVIGAWLLLASKRYAAEHPQVGKDWHVGGTHSVELTLLREDVEHLACASSYAIEGLECGFDAARRPRGSASNKQRTRLAPYFTVNRELLLGAGLWASPALSGPLPASRFSVVCAYHVAGVTKSAAVRWSKTGAFDPLKETVAVGYFTNCAIPR